MDNPQPSRSVRRDHAAILAHYRALMVRCESSALARRREAVSGWNIGQHVEHLVLADATILRALDGLDPAAEPARAAGGPRLIGRVALLTGWLPRGRGKAPDAVVPAGADAGALRRRLEGLEGQVKALLPRLGALEGSSQTVAHPVLGQFRPRHWLRFMALHERHHLKIIGDIEAS